MRIINRLLNLQCGLWILITTPFSVASSTSPSSLLGMFTQRWQKAQDMANLEQSVSDYNAHWIATSENQAQAVRHRRLLALPLDDRFDPAMGIFSHGHVQTGDKMSLPSNFWPAIALNDADVPWLYSVSRIEGVTSARVPYKDYGEDAITPYQPLKALDKVVGGPLDFRAPTNYVFLPLWMFRALGLRPFDIVQVDLIQTVAPGSLARLRPHSKSFTKEIPNPQAVLETELRHYSALTQGSTIAFDFLKKRYWFDVVELRAAPRGEKQPMVKVQDCDIATDFLPSREDMKEKKENLKKLKESKED
ncbi:hypothetical protein FisN_23Hh170 [Fistulifera solaris]|uniref:Ubiquitin fusion degradation protein UFD1 N-terminal subdomain 2 domain-containing protein n=1 Tax=Fistulifera solaris TaxID=1519565 RepID=A0A1Z5K4K3_FISSO|nr:hypothetical protein FisN_23Hh170 [Fistulifera solaris]|eukprot:GAX21155.1 hypothetical protein FisN_23Hh170 [Fistulifera solaris]